LAAPEQTTPSQLFASRQSIAQLPPEQTAPQLFASRQLTSQLLALVHAGVQVLVRRQSMLHSWSTSHAAAQELSTLSQLR
jgi:hypothetical protein